MAFWPEVAWAHLEAEGKEASEGEAADQNKENPQEGGEMCPS